MSRSASVEANIRASVAYPGIADDRPRINVARAQLAKRHSCVVCSIRIVDNGRAIGAVTIERSRETPFSMQEVAEYEQIMCIVGPVLDLKRESEWPWHWRLKKSLS